MEPRKESTHTRDTLCITSSLKSASNLKCKLGKGKEQSPKQFERRGMCGLVVGINEDERPLGFTQGTLYAAKWQRCSGSQK